MLGDIIKICKIIPYTNDDLEHLDLYYKDFALEIVGQKALYEDMTTPILIIGWNQVKKMFPEQKENNSKISDNLFWTYSISEDKEKNTKNIHSFLEFSIRKFFNKPIISYDYIIDGEIKDFLSKNININHKSFIYFHRNVCYIYNNGNTLSISLPSLSFVGKDWKNITTGIVNRLDCLIFSFENISRYTNYEEIENVLTLENIFWSKYNYYLEPKEVLKIFLNNDIHKHIPFFMNILYNLKPLNGDEINYSNRLIKKDKITLWLSKNRVYFKKDFKPSNYFLKFTNDNDKKYLSLNYSS
jgi:hypothetical protein